MRKFKSFFSLFVISIIIISQLFVTVAFSQISNNKSESSSLTSENINYSKADWTGKGIYSKFKPSDEITGSRTRSSKHFFNTDSSRTAVIASGYSLNYFENGIWNTISREIKVNRSMDHQEYGYLNSSNIFKTYYSAMSNINGIITSLREGEIMEWVDPQMYYLVDGEKVNVQSINSSLANINDNEILYPESYEDVDVRFIQGNDGRKMDIVLKSPDFLNNSPEDAYLVFQETIKIPDGWTMNESEGCINLFNEKNEWIIRYEKPLFYDNNFNKSSGKSEAEEGLVSYKGKDDSYIRGKYIVSINKNNIIISIPVPLKWLKDKNRKFPVVIDPTVSIYPANSTYYTGCVSRVWNTGGSYNYTKSDDSLYHISIQLSTTSSYDNVSGFMKFDLSSLSGISTISSAIISYYCSASEGFSSMPNNIYPLTNDPVTASAQTLWNDCGDGSSVASGTWNCSSCWYNWPESPSEITNLYSRIVSPGWTGYGVVRGGTYWYDFMGHSSSSYKPYLSVTYCITPGAPTSLTSNVTGQASANLSWAGGSPSGSTTINYYWEVYTTDGTYITGNNTGTLSATASGLTCGTMYYFRVQSKTTCDNSASSWINSSNFTTGICCVTPGNPDSLSTVVTGPSSVTLKWTPGIPAGAPTITYYYEVFSSGGSLVFSNSTTSQQAAITSLTCNSNYYFRVMAHTNCGTGGYSNWVISSAFLTDPCDMTVPNTGNDSYTVCGGHIYDFGGSTSDYGNYWDGYSVIYPGDITKAVQVSGNYNTEFDNDFIEIYDGSGLSGTLLGSFWGSGSIPAITSSGTNIPLTIRFHSNSSISAPGFDITITCVQPCINQPTAPVSVSCDRNNICSDDTGTILFSSSGGTGTTSFWFTPYCGGFLEGIGNPASINSPTVTTTYYVGSYTSGCINSSCNSITVTVFQAPFAPVTAKVDTNNYCNNYSGNITLSLSGGSGSFAAWYVSGCGVSQIGTGVSLTLPTPGIPTTYYANWHKTSCGNTTCVTANLMVYASPIAPQSALSDRNNYCSNAGGTLSLSVSGGFGLFVGWYRLSCGGTYQGSGNPKVLTAPTSSATFWARWESACGVSACASEFITVLPLPSTPAFVTVDRNNLCSNDGGNINLSTSGGSGLTLNWFISGCGNTLIGTGKPLTIPAPTITTTYYVRWANSCSNSNCKSLIETIYPSPTPPSSAASDRNNFCSTAGGNITLTASGGTSSTIGWYAISCNFGSIGTGNPLVIIAPTITTTYYVNGQSTGCFNSNCISLIVSVFSSPAAPVSASVDRNNICSDDGGTINLSINGGSGAVAGWFINGCGVTSVGTGISLNVTSPITTSTYWANWQSAGCTNSNCVSITETVIPGSVPPSSVFSDRNNYCSNSGGSINLTSSGGSGTSLQWSSTSCGGVLIGTGHLLTITAPSVTSVYYNWWQKAGCSNSSCLSIAVIVYPLPVTANLATTSRNNICSSDNGNISLSLSGGSGLTVGWYVIGCGTAAIGTGNPFIYPSPLTTTTYWASRQSPTCPNSGCRSVTVTIIPAPAAPSYAYSNLSNLCINAGGNISLDVSGGFGNALVWYMGSCDGTIIGSGKPFVIASPTTTTFYYASWQTTGCAKSNCVSVVINIIQLPSSPGTITGSTNVCAITQQSYDVSIVSGTGYSWTAPSGWTGSSTSNSIIYTAGSVSGNITVIPFNSCGNGPASSKYILVNTLSSPATSVTATPSVICPGSSSTLALTGGSLGTGASWHWYTGSCGGTIAGTGLSLIKSPTVSNTYYVRAENICNTTTCKSVRISLNTYSIAPASAVSNPSGICQGDLSTLSFTGGTLGTAAIWYWYSGSCGGTIIGTGAIIVINPAITGSYHIRASGLCNTTGCLSTTVTIIQNSVQNSSISSSSSSVCAGVIDSLSISGGTLTPGAHWYWYSGSCGNNFIDTGRVITINPTITTKYYARIELGCNTTSCISITIAINLPPVAPNSLSTDRNNYCSNTGGIVTLTSSGGSGGTLVWYRISCGGTLVGTGNPKIIAAPVSSTRYWARWEQEGCSSSTCISISITVLTSPTAPAIVSSSDNNFCYNQGGTITLTGSGGTGTTFGWYTASCGGTGIGTGRTLVISSPTVTTKYWGRLQTVLCSNSSCKSIIVNVISGPPSQPGSISGNQYPNTGTTETYNITDVPGTTYSWTAPSAWYGTSTSSSITYITGVTQGSISVTPSNDCGTGLARTLIIHHFGYILSGSFNYDNSSNSPLDSIWVFLMQNGQKLDSVQADINGLYQFYNVPDGIYNITATTHKMWAGINATDAVKAKRHFAGSELFNSSLRLHAADVNLSDNINTTDAVKISRRFVGSDTTFTRGDWIFEKPFGGDTIGVSPTMNDTITINGGNVVQNFKGLCVGDVNGSNFPVTGPKSLKKVQLEYTGIKRLNSNEYFELPIISKSDIDVGAISMVLNFPKEFISIDDIECLANNEQWTMSNEQWTMSNEQWEMSNEGNNLIFNVMGNELRIGWYKNADALNININKPVIIIRGKTTNNFHHGDMIKFRLADSPLCEFADEEGNPIDNVVVETFTIEHSTGQKITNNLGESINDLFIYPNPAEDILNINYYIVDDGHLKISLYNIFGKKVIDVVNQAVMKGNYHSEINNLSIPSGIYSCKMVLDGKNVIVKRVIISK